MLELTLIVAFSVGGGVEHSYTFVDLRQFYALINEWRCLKIILVFLVLCDNCNLKKEGNE